MARACPWATPAGAQADDVGWPAAAARRADVGDVRERGSGGRCDDDRDRPQRVAHEAGALARSARSPPAAARRVGEAATAPSTGHGARASATGDAERSGHGPAEPTNDDGREQRPARGRSAARRRIASAGSSVVTMSGRPEAGRHHGPPPASRSGRPATSAWSTEETSTRSRTGVAGARPGGDAVGDVGGGALRTRASRRRGPRRSRASSIAMRRGPRGPRTGRPRGRSSKATQPDPSRAARARVRRKTSGRPASSSKSSSASIRPVDPDVARPTALGELRRASAMLTRRGSRRGSGRRDARPEASAGPAAPATSATRPGRMRRRGVTAAIIRDAAWKRPEGTYSTRGR